MPAPPRVALLVETARSYGRDLLRGVVRYARLHGPWSFHLTPGDFEQVLPRMRAWGGAGIIARIETPEVARAILASGLPTIVLDLAEAQSRAGLSLASLSEIASDSQAAARLAADHLLEKGLRNFAFVGIPGRDWSLRRQEGFRQRLEAAGHGLNSYPPKNTARPQPWERELPRLSQWLTQLPRPLGLMACNDDRGRQVLEACRAAGLRVPEDLAVIGVDNDELLCDLADPPLTSVALNAEAGGFRAAALLDLLMRGKVRKPRHLLVEPLGVVTRRSTDIQAISDPLVADAIRFLHDHATEPVGVVDVLDHLVVSRRTLEIRFRQAMGRTLRQELERVRLERVMRLLRETDLPLPRIARAAGFTSASYLSQVFNRQYQTSPTQYRQRMRAEDPPR